MVCRLQLNISKTCGSPDLSHLPLSYMEQPSIMLCVAYMPIFVGWNHPQPQPSRWLCFQPETLQEHLESPDHFTWEIIGFPCLVARGCSPHMPAPPKVSLPDSKSACPGIGFKHEAWWCEVSFMGWFTGMMRTALRFFDFWLRHPDNKTCSELTS